MLAPPWIPVPPPGYGGVELVVALLCDALHDAGHRVTLLAAPGSRARGRVVELLDRAYPEAIGAGVIEADHVGRAFDLIEDAALAGEPFDVVHDHSGWVALAMADRCAAPVVHTVHGPFEERAAAFYRAHGHRAVLTCISAAQAAARPDGVEIAAVVPNPIDVDAWPVVPKGEHVLWLGRFTPEKGPHRAIAVARRAGVPLVLAGPVQPGQREFFERAVAPHVDGRRIRYAGEVGGARKRHLLASARALLMPIRWPEPFGMVMVEAMAAGTPVLAFAEGAAPEVVEHGRSGLLVGDDDEMAAALDEAMRLRPAECRASARERFSPERVARAYLTVYRRAAGARAARPRLSAAA
jgi:glycosyltransferase involved in cell wall biosynthesis